MKGLVSWTDILTNAYFAEVIFRANSSSDFIYVFIFKWNTISGWGRFRCTSEENLPSSFQMKRTFFVPSVPFLYLGSYNTTDLIVSCFFKVMAPSPNTK